MRIESSPPVVPYGMVPHPPCRPRPAPESYHFDDERLPQPAELPENSASGAASPSSSASPSARGIFRTPASVTNRLPGPAAVFTVWIAGGIVAMCGALTLAEVAGAFPETGGIFVFIRKAWGRLPAFLFGWAELAIIRAAARRRDRHDLRRVFSARAWLRSDRRTVRQLGPLRRRRRDRGRLRR